MVTYNARFPVCPFTVIVRMNILLCKELHYRDYFRFFSLNLENLNLFKSTRRQDLICASDVHLDLITS